MTDRELMQQALGKMEYMLAYGEWYEPEKTITALRDRLERKSQITMHKHEQLLKLAEAAVLIRKVKRSLGEDWQEVLQNIADSIDKIADQIEGRDD